MTATESEIVEIAQSIVEELARERRDAGFTRTDAEIEAIERGFRSLSGPGTDRKVVCNDWRAWI